jgi:16S rRNA (guanine1207-N2)-methyltransferase
MIDAFEFQENILGNDLSFSTNHSVFSPRQIDAGSRFLLENLKVTKGINIVDLGCGYGAMGISLAKAFPENQIYLVDDDNEAVRLTKENIARNNLKNATALRSDGLYLINKTKKISLIITNPPWHKMQDTHRFIDQAKEILDDNGQFWMVIRAEFPVQDNLVETFGNFKEVARESPYKILKAVKDPAHKSLRGELITALYDNNTQLDPAKDQHMLVDGKVMEKIVETISPKTNDQILEVGSGDGFLTRLLAKSAKKVIGVELDEKFRPFLDTLPRNVTIHYGKAWDILHDKTLGLKYNKVVSNLPYSMSEPILHRYTHMPLDLLVFLFPIKFSEKIKTNPVFSAFYKIEIIDTVPRAAFFPQPKIDSVIVKLTQLPKKLTIENAGLWTRRFLYEHEEAKVKNTLRIMVEQLSSELKGKKLTKNEARTIVDSFNIDPKLLELDAHRNEIYGAVETAVKSWLLAE